MTLRKLLALILMAGSPTAWWITLMYLGAFPLFVLALLVGLLMLLPTQVN